MCVEWGADNGVRTSNTSGRLSTKRSATPFVRCPRPHAAALEQVWARLRELNG
jgi:hypothetical protein